jgi:NADH-quinone oxidoreductase subunit J
MQDYFTLNISILVLLVASALWTAMTRSLIRSALGLALTSVILTLIMFSFRSWLAAMFELSVCAGLISVVFISAISVTHPLTRVEVMERMRSRLKRFGYLPFLVVIIGVGLSLLNLKFSVALPLPEAEVDARAVLWNLRGLELFAQVAVILAGAFGVIILFREMRRR